MIHLITPKTKSIDNINILMLFFYSQFGLPGSDAVDFAVVEKGEENYFAERAIVETKQKFAILKHVLVRVLQLVYTTCITFISILHRQKISALNV